MRVGSHSLQVRKLAFFIGEELVLFGAFLVSAQLWGRVVGISAHLVPLAAQAFAVTLALQVGLYLADLYDFRVALRDAPRARRLLQTLGAVTICCGLISLVVPVPMLAVAGLGGTCTVALITRAALPDLGRRFALRARIYLVGQGAAEQALRHEIQREGVAEVVGSADLATHDLATRARATGAQAIVVAVDDKRGLNVRELLACRLAGVEVFDATLFAERVLKKIPVQLARPSDLVFSDGFDRPGWLLLARRAVSLAASLLLFVLATPLLIVAAVLIKLDSQGPVFYSQERVGAGGRVFRMLKFRTMRTDAEAVGAVWAQKADPRVTRVGRLLRRFRIDELPQLFNVLVGDMGVVGPRPERPEFVAQLRMQIPYYDLRTLVPPGITGWAQIRYPYAASLEEAQEKLQYDLYYVKHLSVLLDLVILFHTAKVVLFGRGAR